MSAPTSIQITKHQKPTLDNVKQNQQEPNKFHYNFAYKATIVLIFFVILPLLPSQAPEFISQNLLTRNWELLHLLFVGIAISYGLFSRRNQEPDKDNNNNTKFDNAQSLVSRFLQVSSFFEDEVDHQNQSESEDINKIQTWSNQNQHYRNKPMVIVAPQVQQLQNSVFEDEQSSFNENEKPLLLPVRSLKSLLSDDDCVVQSQSVDGLSKTTTKRFSSNSFNRVRNYAEFEGLVEDKLKQKEEENAVLPSPIPWRSRSASARMMEPKQEAIEKALKASMVMEPKQEANENASKPSMVKTSSIKFTPSESVAKNSEDLIKKKSFYYKSYPPPPPPPPPTMFYKSTFLKSRYGEKNGRNMSMGKSIEEGTNEKEDEDEEEKEYSTSSMQEQTDKERFIEKRVILEAEETDSDEDEDVGELKQSVKSVKTEEPCSSSLSGGIDTVSDEGPDVDKKADEFIAKFREQIRLQRIESIKRSTRVARNSSR
ncbi:transmembrane protein, putative [Medicago truncatula]|uniref:Transmembrane protein, putative n=1 Tax=Medicago truncatula TaxID=3880 RepID=G7JHP7_MEDTR|nr:transmembrane protein, putative [Medicago truncatula]